MKPLFKRHWVLFLGIFVFLTLAASPGWCGGLTRAEAAKIISKGGPTHIYLTLPTGKVRTGSLIPFPGQASREDYLKAWVALESMGYINLKILDPKVAHQHGKPIPPYARIVNISLTKKGKKAFKKVKYRIWKLEICRIVFLKITGILMKNNYTALVEFEWKVEGVTPLTKAVYNISPLKNMPRRILYQVQKISVILKKYDDGWRYAENS